jgi:hypothetical protein
VLVPPGPLEIKSGRKRIRALISYGWGCQNERGTQVKTIISGQLSALCVAVVVSLSLAATAQTPPPGAAERREDAKERREDARERREDAKERREDAREKREDVREKRDDVREKRDDVREKRDDVRERRDDRLERKKARVKELRERWGETARKPAARAEIKVHVHRMARLRHIRAIAEAKGKTAIVTRVDKLIEREKSRHQRVMDRVKGQGG